MSKKLVFKSDNNKSKEMKAKKPKEPQIKGATTFMLLVKDKKTGKIHVPWSYFHHACCGKEYYDKENSFEGDYKLDETRFEVVYKGVEGNSKFVTCKKCIQSLNDGWV